MKQTGVYAITCSVTHRRYIGSAANAFKIRWKAHRSALRAGRHHSPRLQHDWNTYGESAFEFSVLVACPPFQCVPFEQRMIDEFRSKERKYGYNILPTAGSPLGHRHTPETIAKMKAIFAARTPEYKAWLLSRNQSADANKKKSDAARGRVMSAEWRKKIGRPGKIIPLEARINMSAAQKRRYQNPEQRRVAAKHLGRWREINNQKSWTRPHKANGQYAKRITNGIS